jgi:hypothetical protein
MQARAYVGVSRETYERIKNDLRARGVTVADGDVCTIEHRGLRGSLEYVEARQEVRIRILQKPFFIPEAGISSMLERAMRRYGLASTNAG